MAFHCFAWATTGVLGLMAGYLLIVYKLQARSFHMLLDDLRHLPEESNPYNLFLGFLWAAAAGAFVRVCEVIWVQTRADIFFLDWERPRGLLAQTGGQFFAGAAASASAGQLLQAERGNSQGIGQSSSSASASAGGVQGQGQGQGAAGSSSSQGAGGPGAAGGRRAAKAYGLVGVPAPISVWRTLFMANEWSEIQSVRRVHTVLLCATLAVMLDAGSMIYVATPKPDAGSLTPGPLNPMLQFASLALWFSIVASTQWLWVWGIWERFIAQAPHTRFIDLCTVAKVSLLVLDDKYHGYYLHCDAPTEFADVSMASLVAQLQDEQGFVRGGRGLPGAPSDQADQQAFEIHLPKAWRDKYDSHFVRLREYEKQLELSR